MQHALGVLQLCGGVADAESGAAHLGSQKDEGQREADNHQADDDVPRDHGGGAGLEDVTHFFLRIFITEYSVKVFVFQQGNEVTFFNEGA